MCDTQERVHVKTCSHETIISESARGSDFLLDNPHQRHLPREDVVVQAGGSYPGSIPMTWQYMSMF